MHGCMVGCMVGVCSLTRHDVEEHDLEHVAELRRSDATSTVTAEPRGQKLHLGRVKRGVGVSGGRGEGRWE